MLKVPTLAERRLRSLRGPVSGHRSSRAADSPATEAAGAFGLLGLLGIVAYGVHVLDGGFYYDDWAHLASYRFPNEPGIVGRLEQAWENTGYRPLLVPYYPLQFAIFGGHFRLHLAWALFLAVAMSASLYLLMRVLGLARVHAFAIAALVLVFPFADAPRLWVTASAIHVTVLLFVAGLLVALRGLEAPTRRSAVKHHAAAAGLYLASLLFYEVTAGLVLAAGLLYAWRGSFRRALPRFAVDAALVAAVYVRLRSESEIPQSSSIRAMFDHARIIADQGLSLVSGAMLPRTDTPRGVALGIALVVLSAALVTAARLPSGDPVRAELRRWLFVAAGGAVVITAGWAVYVPAHPYYSPGTLGLGNRVNVIASIGIVALAYALAAMAGVLLFGRLLDWRRWAFGFGMSAAALLLVAYMLDVRDDVRDWDRAYAHEQEVLAALRAAVPDPPPGATLYTFNHPTWQAPGVPVFASTWDLLGAARVVYDDRDVVAYPILPGVTFVCGATEPVSERGRLWPGARRPLRGGHLRRHRCAPGTDRRRCIDMPG